MTIPEFIARCDRYCAAAERTRVWLSKRLLDDTYRLDKLAKGEVDIGVTRLERACSDLTVLEDGLDVAAARRSQDAAA